ncbi:hypothetical protein EDB81DRAFT_765078 [Dactylonectria macrodidyma]|uniref:Major facilitator superfamily (MFS) profile domain-containing protein n=1 Tax=Dactylonectria macrodidyma TaxID=307937 RepID=A0A9P9INX4_9HYPO|nr:hypothetical protein EDB81DRAFT_765078 [Dactylonectria macrodidyma]
MDVEMGKNTGAQHVEDSPADHHPTEEHVAVNLEEEPAPKLTFQTMMAFIGPDTRSIWITVSWQLGAAAVVSIAGRTYGIFGHQYFLLTGAGLGILGSLIGATAESIPQMIASRVVFGIAAGF